MLNYNLLKNRGLHSGGQGGFTLIELMIVLAIIAILMNLAMVSYKDYLVRSKISSGITLAASAKASVTEYYNNRGMMPVNNTEAGLAQAASITNQYVVSVGVGTVPTSGTVTITYSMPELNPGDSIRLSPTPQAGSVQWICSSDTMKITMLPSSCR